MFPRSAVLVRSRDLFLVLGAALLLVAAPLRGQEGRPEATAVLPAHAEKSAVPRKAVDPQPTLRMMTLETGGVAATIDKASLLAGQARSVAGSCDGECDYCWCGTNNEGNCPLDWFYDKDCDCGCQFCDLACPDCAMQDCLNTLCGPGCDFCHIGTPQENNCPAGWCGAGDGCDCGCQFTDADCPGGSCGCNSVCGNGTCECACNETTANCPQDCVDVPCGDATVIDVGVGVEFGNNKEMCAVTVVSCPCEAWCAYCNDGYCDPAWNGDGECDCGCQFCDIDCPTYPDCCLAGPAESTVCVEVFPPELGSVSCLIPPTCTGVSPICGASVLNPSTGDYEFCTVYTPEDTGESCVRFWIDWPETDCDPELWWRFNQTCSCGNGVCESSCSEDCSTCPGDCGACSGACCLVSGACADGYFQAECSAARGTYMGDGSTCTGGTVTCASPCAIVSSFPPNCAIDGRYPNPVDLTGEPPAVWNAIVLMFNPECDTSAMGPGDFESASPINAVVPNGNAVTVRFARPIPPGQWTCVEHLESGESVCLGALPGDVAGDGTSNAADVLELIDELNGRRPPPPLEIWQCDIDRSNACTPADILGVIDMLNGGWNNHSLPRCPAGG